MTDFSGTITHFYINGYNPILGPNQTVRITYQRSNTSLFGFHFRLSYRKVHGFTFTPPHFFSFSSLPGSHKLSKTSVLRQPIKNRHMENTNFTLKSSLQTTDSKQNEERNPAKAHAFTSSFTPNLHHRHTDRRSRMISRKKEFSPNPPPHHTPEQNNFEEEEFAGAWKQIGAAVSHDPKVCFS